MTTLSLCMIVRDEAEMLPRFLQAAQGLYDELCVVDTGSTDNTVQILREAGAKVVERPWQDDFALARNQSLELATCARVLVLDADEMVNPTFVAACRRLVADPTVGAATVTMSNAVPHGHRKYASLLRLFRNTEAVRFTHRIHEDVTQAVLADLAAEGLKLGHVAGDIEHLGYERGRCEARGKKERDTNLLWQCIQEDPSDLYSWFKLLEQGQFWDDVELSEQAAEGIEQLLEELEAVPEGCGHFFGPMVVALAMSRRTYDETGALALVQHWCAQVPDDAALRLYLGQLHESAGAAAEAEADYRHCMTLSASTVDTQLISTRPELGLARICLGRSDLEGAMGYVERALARHPRDLEGLLALASMGQALGGDAMQARLAEVYTEAYGEVAEMHAAWGEAALLCGQRAEAETRFAKACELDPSTAAYAQRLQAARAEPSVS